MAYATTSDIDLRYNGIYEPNMANAFLDDAAIIIDAYNASASEDAKKIVSCNMVIRKLGELANASAPMGATQGSMSALGYSQSWTMGNGGAVGELYLTKTDKKILGASNKIGSYSPVQELVSEGN